MRTRWTVSPDGLPAALFRPHRPVLPARTPGCYYRSRTPFVDHEGLPLEGAARPSLNPHRQQPCFPRRADSSGGRLCSCASQQRLIQGSAACDL
eukprot:1633310-Pleurochrysis_carterae.AAC.1